MTHNRNLKMSDASKEEQNVREYAHLQHILTYHQQLLSDRVRNQTFHKALKRHLRKGARVLDIGSGTGVWAIVAAKLGAAKVVAIEREKLLIPIIERLAAKNGVANIVDVIEGDSRQVKIPGRFNLIVSETVGNYGFEEEIVPILIDARKRFLKKDGVVIPRELTAVVAPAHLTGANEPLPAGLNLNYSFFQTLNNDISKKISDPTLLQLLARPASLAKVDLTTVTTPPPLTDMKCSWRVRDGSAVNCLVVFAQVVLTKGISLNTRQHNQGWNPVCLPLEPFPPGPAQIECTITHSNKQYYWVVTHTQKGERLVQSHSPVFPYAVIQSRLQR